MLSSSVWQRTTLRARLVLSMVGLVGGVVLAISILYFHALARDRMADARDRAAANADNVKSFVVERVTAMTRTLPRRPRTVEESRQLWTIMIREDAAVRYLLRTIVANSNVILDVVITDASGTILSAPDAQQVGQAARVLPRFEDWYRQGVWPQLRSIFTEDREFEVSIPLGVSNQTEPLFFVRAEVSTTMLRTTLYPNLRSLAIASGIIVLLSILVAAIVATLLLRPIERLNRMIDQLSRGEMAVETLPAGESREFAAARRKLGMLASQFRGAKEDVEQMRSNLGRMLQRLEEAVLLFDAEDQLVAAGAPAERLLQRSTTQLIGSRIEELFPASGALGAAVQRARESREAIRDMLVECSREDGGRLRLLLNVDPLNQDGVGRLGTMVTLRDAETRSQLETQIDVSTRVAAISRLTGGVAHEVKNPLNAITLHLEVLRAQLARQSPASVTEIEIIAAEVARLDRVVKTFIDFTRPVSMEIRTVNFAQIVREAVTHLAGQAARQGVSLRMTKDSDNQADLLGDPVMLSQAVMNVMMNAIEASAGTGSVEVDLHQSSGDYVLSVIDEGSGVAPDIRDKIFNLFYTTKKTAGGIGLAIAFQVVQLHNGAIEFENRPQGGSIFRLRFPVVHAAAGRAEAMNHGRM